MPKIGINILIRLILLLSSTSATVVFTTSAKQFGNPCINYNEKAKQGVIKIKEINKRYLNPCRNSQGNVIDILHLKENGRNYTGDTNLILCTPPRYPELILQFKGTITNVVSRHGVAEVLTCRQISDTLIVKTSLVRGENKPSYILMKIRQNQRRKHFGVLSIMDDNNYRKRDTYELQLPAHIEDTILRNHDYSQNRVQRDVHHTENTGVSRLNSTYQPTDPSECGVTRACFRIGSDSCSHYQCLYYLSYKVSKDKNNVDIELSGKTSGWIAVGFSVEDKRDSDDAIACVRNGKDVNVMSFTDRVSGRQVVQKPSLSNLTHSEIRGRFLYCRITLPISRTSEDKSVNYINLNKQLYQLYARGPISEDGNIFKGDDLQISKSAKRMSIFNTDVDVQSIPTGAEIQPTPLYQHNFITASSECGGKRGCFRHGSQSCSHFQCLYYFSYKVNKKRDKVDIELSGKTSGWLAVGFSSDNKMGGDDIVACVKKPQSGVTVMAYSDPLPHQRPEEKPSQANVSHLESRDGFIYCRMVIPTTRKPSNERISYLDLSNEWYQLYARGPVSSGGNMLQHHETPMTSSSQLTIFRNVNVHRNQSSVVRARYNYVAIFISFLLLSFFPA